MEPFWEFLRDVFDTWVEKVGIILTILPFIEKIPRVKTWLNEKPIIDRFVPVLWCIGISCIIWGFYSAWLTQYRDVQAKQKRIDELSRPDFEVAHATTMVSELDMTNQDASVEHYAGVLIPLVVVNKGAPSIIRGWKLSAKLKDGDEVQGIPLALRGQYLIFPDPKGNEVKLPMSSCLFQKATEAPIPTGGQADGWVLFKFPVEHKAALTTAALTLDIEDVAHKHYLDVIQMTGKAATEFFGSPSMRSE